MAISAHFFLGILDSIRAAVLDEPVIRSRYIPPSRFLGLLGTFLKLVCYDRDNGPRIVT